MTLLLGRSDLEQLLDPSACMQTLRKGFVAAPSRIAPRRVRTDLTGPGTATALIPGLVDGVPAYTVKVNAKFPRSRPALRGVVCLHDLGTGELLAVLDSATVTAYRTGLSAAVGTHALARREAATVAVVGAGAQADLVIRGLALLRSWEGLLVCDVDTARAEDFARRHEAATVSLDPREAARRADVIVLATWSRTPLLDDADVMPGTHLTSLGADEPGKSELSAGLLRSARVVVDDVSLAVTSGALGTAGLTAADAATLGEVLRGTTPGRRDDADRTVYSPVGLPWQDLALAWTAYCRARASGVGDEFDFLS